jgi:hypothetical protein
VTLFMAEVIAMLDRSANYSAILILIEHILASPKLRDQFRNIPKQNLDTLAQVIIDRVSKK